MKKKSFLKTFFEEPSYLYTGLFTSGLSALFYNMKTLFKQGCIKVETRLFTDGYFFGTALSRELRAMSQKQARSKLRAHSSKLHFHFAPHPETNIFAAPK
ncbi:MAG: hypothetical protein V4539_09685 [Bacteroidota bacterium]